MAIFPISAYVGVNGAGKSLAVVSEHVVPAWAEGRPVVSNCTLHPEAAGYDPSLYVPLESWRQIPGLRSALLFIDEVQSIFPGRSSQSLPPEMQRMLHQMRKCDLSFVWSGVDFSNADVLLRQCTQRITVCRGFWPDEWIREDLPGGRRRPAKSVDDDGRPMRWRDHGGWPPNRLFSYVTWDARDFVDFTDGKRNKVKPKRARWYWRPGKLAQHCYDSGEQVMLMDHLDEIGRCVNCGGKRRAKQCRCTASEVDDETSPHDQPMGAGADRTARSAEDRTAVRSLPSAAVRPEPETDCRA